ncbi:MAG: 3-phosphoshikimate 1-carboxyvinyltransferase [Bacteroidales bacterium]
MTLRLLPKVESESKLSVSLSGSKSISNRVLIINAISNNFSSITNLAACDDTRSMLSALNSNANSFDVGHAGTTMRFLTAYLSGMYGEWVITGSDRMQQRPIRLLVDALRELGADIEYLVNEGFPPLKIRGRKLMGGKIEMNGDVSSQYISALLMIAPRLAGGLTVTLNGELMSMPYIDMTLRLMRDFGISCSRSNNALLVEEGEYSFRSFTVEGDWSSASYWFSIVALSKYGFVVEVSPLFKDSSQGDRELVHIFEQLGVRTKWLNRSVISIEKIGGATCSCLELNLRSTPDIAQTLAVCCCGLGLPFIFTGLETLKIKETDRISALINELAKCGYCLEAPIHGSLIWSGKKQRAMEVPRISTYHDHRMAMAFAPLGLKNAIVIEDEGVVSKSYEAFWSDLQILTNQEKC